MSKIYNDITKTIGNIPLVRINRLTDGARPNRLSADTQIVCTSSLSK
jgi:hypothetical protein